MPSSTLHTLNKTAQATTLNLKLSQSLNKGDEVILIEDGVYQCITLFSEATTPCSSSSENNQTWSKLAKTIYALKEDALARGISLKSAGIIFITYEEFVKLSLAHKKVISWY